METAWKFIIQESDGCYYCVICGWDLAGYENALNHVVGRYHRDAVLEHGVDISHDGYHNFYCHLCHCKIPGYANVRCHIKGRRHQDYLFGLEWEIYDDTDSDEFSD